MRESESTARNWVLALIVCATAALYVSQVMRSVPLQSANDRSRWATVKALGERGEYAIDEEQTRRGWASIDVARHDDHFFSTKPPLFPTVVAGLYAANRAVTGWTLDERLLDTTRLLLLLVNVLPSVAALAAFAWTLTRLSDDLFATVFVTLAAGIGTLNVPFLASLNNHSVAVWSLTLAVAAAVWHGESRSSLARTAAAVLAGLFAGWTACNELPSLAFAVLLFSWFALRDAKRAAFGFAPSFALVVVAFFITNYAAVGDWKPLYTYYGTEKYLFTFEGRDSYWMNPQGLDRNLDSAPVYLMHCLIGHHGLFSLTPVFLISAIGWTLLPNLRGRLLCRSLAAAGLGLGVLTLGFFLTRTQNYNYGGVSVALRWMLWLSPLWLIAALPALERYRSNGVRTLAVGAMAASVYSAWSPGPNPWQHPWLFRAMEQAGWIAY